MAQRPKGFLDLKWCGSCRQVHNISEFSKDRSRNDGLSSRCKSCDQRRARLYEQEHRSLVRARERAHYADNREQILADLRQERAKNPEPFRERERAKRAENPDQARAHWRAYAERNRSLLASKEAFRRGKRKAGEADKFTRDEIYERDCGRCRYCRKKVGPKWHLAHLVALANGGSHTRENVAVSCVRCNLTDGIGRSSVQLHMETA